MQSIVDNSRRVVLTKQEMSNRGGCQCKLGGDLLTDLLASAFPGNIHSLSPFEDSSVISDPQTLLSPLLFANDLAPLIGIDLWQAGVIGALHSMSDIYASGGRPRWCLVTLQLTPDDPVGRGTAIMDGVNAACSRSGSIVVGGHTLLGPELMVGMSVIGVPQSSTIIRKRCGSPGDVLMLSKPLGVGLATQAFKLGVMDTEGFEEALNVMMASNESASVAAVEAGITAGTDVSGFGFLGHLGEMLGESLGATIFVDSVPVLKCVRGLPAQSGRTSWALRNRDYVSSDVEIEGVTDPTYLTPLLDPQTNGGLLVAANPSVVQRLMASGFVPVGRLTENHAINLSKGISPDATLT
jgi:selenide, water dikinase